MAQSDLKTYQYKAINKHGRMVNGVLSASDDVHLAHRLQDLGMDLVRAKHMAPRSSLFNFGGSKKIPIRDLLQLFIQLEQMQSAGVMLLDALGHCRSSISNKELIEVVNEMHRLVSEGASMSEAMKQYPEIFKTLQVAIVGSAEETGDMVGAYKYLITYLKWLDEMQKRVKKATRYPMMLGIAVIVTVVVMMGYVVPQVIGFMTSVDTGNELPVYTLALIATSEFFQAFWWIIISVIAAAGISIAVMRKLSDNFKYQTDAIFLTIPVVGPLVQKIDIAQFSYTVGALFSAGIPLLRCLDTAKNTVTNTAMSRSIHDVGQEMAGGMALSEALGNTGHFPSMVIQMIKIAEESGKMTEVLNQIAEFYNSDVDEAVEAAIAMIEPAMTLFLGLLIGWIALAVFGPIYDMFETMDF